MPLETRLLELQRKHSRLKDQIQEALAHPSHDEAKVHEIKRRKLLLKDEIERLKAEQAKAGL